MKPTILIYVNSHVAHHLNHPILKKYLNNKIGHNKWVGFGDIIIPELIKDTPEYLTDNFFHGISAHQFTMIKKGGTFINPMLYGLHNDFDMWNDILHEEPDFFKEVVYIDVPFVLYDEVVTEDDYKVNEEKYNDMNKIIENMVHDIRKVYYNKREVH